MQHQKFRAGRILISIWRLRRTVSNFMKSIQSKKFRKTCQFKEACIRKIKTLNEQRTQTYKHRSNIVFTFTKEALDVTSKTITAASADR
mmetsp:Transcript_35560/g.43990  ORF Transcript_35560/g.43990 Transcript_35560/m.43990 type:complete len:89 (-) Transcript_35560:423-689(-)